jgi:hypothetical protein
MTSNHLSLTLVSTIHVSLLAVLDFCEHLLRLRIYWIYLHGTGYE